MDREGKNRLYWLIKEKNSNTQNFSQRVCYVLLLTFKANSFDQSSEKRCPVWWFLMTSAVTFGWQGKLGLTQHLPRGSCSSAGHILDPLVPAGYLNKAFHQTKSVAANEFHHFMTGSFDRYFWQNNTSGPKGWNLKLVSKTMSIRTKISHFAEPMTWSNFEGKGDSN